ncbi:MAG TPA: hypothetical protein VJT82_05665, partial [Pyrinomonadaceae bacterium]|nr:hypothetical protein [Pyrinomonadaceae bacterium]
MNDECGMTNGKQKHLLPFIVHRSAFIISDNALSVVAVFHNGAAFAQGVAGAAEGAPVPDEVDV